VQLCPYHTAAKYVYVARHPVSCFASCVDFMAANMGAFTPGLDEIEQWPEMDREARWCLLEELERRREWAAT